VRRQIQARLKTLEQRLPRTALPAKAVLPAWLVEQLQSQGIPFHSDGRPDLKATAGSERV
jgi:hypothetical protein